MIEEVVEVVAIEDEYLILQSNRKSSCQSCSVQKGCGTSVLSQWLGKKMSHFRIENTTNSSVGDQLIVGISENGLLMGSFFVYFLPLVSLILGALMADLMLEGQLDNRDLWVGASGFLGLGVGIGMCRKLLNRSSYSQLAPVILRKNVEHVKLSS